MARIHHGKRSTLLIVLLTAALGLLAPTVIGTSAGDQAREKFYFLGPNLFPFEQGIVGLIPYDLNGDERTDLVLLDNRASKFRLLLQPDPDDQDEEPEEELDVNELPEDRLLNKEEVRIDSQVLAYTVAPIGGAQAALVSFTENKELTVHRRTDSGQWETGQRFLLDLESAFCGGLESADLDGNGLEDILVLTQNSLLVFFQDNDGKLAEPREFPVAIENSRDLVLGDVDGDGRQDITYRAPTTRYPLRIRLAGPDGTPGPERRFRMPPLRELTMGDCTGAGRMEMAVIEATTNRIKILRWESLHESEQAEPDEGSLMLIPYPQGKKTRRRDHAVADINGDGLPDVVVTQPGSARIGLMLARRDSGLQPVESFPALQGEFAIAAVPLEDRPAEILMCSQEEDFLGVSVYDSTAGRLDYPHPIDVAGTPCAVAAVGSRGSAPALAYCVVLREEDEASSKDAYAIVTLHRLEDGYHEIRRQNLPDLKKTQQLVALDANGNGLCDLLAFPDYGSPELLVQSSDGTFRSAGSMPDFQQQMLRDLKPAAVASAPSSEGESPALFLALGNLIRVARFEEDQLVVLDQFSNASGRASYAAICPADLDGDGAAEILAIDDTAKWLSVLARDEKGVYAATDNIEVGQFEFIGLHVADVDGSGSREVLLVGRDKLGVLSLDKATFKLEEVAVIETEQDDAAYGQVVVCDLNGDGKNELLLNDVKEHHLEVLYRVPGPQWKPGMRFKVFEERRFEGRGAPTPEPRQVVAAELTGDGLTDIAIICHDRCIVYPQQGPDD